jgi:hypothetical protein
MIASVVAHPGAAMVSADQMLTWLDGRNASTLSSFSWNGSQLTFAVNAE